MPRRSDPSSKTPEIVPHHDWTALRPLLTEVTADRILKSDNPNNALTLYCFLARLSASRGNSTVQANVNYCGKGLGWGKDRVQGAKKTLLDLGLIENIIVRGQAGTVKKWLLRIRYVPRGTFSTEFEKFTQNHQPGFSSGGETGTKVVHELELEVDLKLCPHQSADGKRGKDSSPYEPLAGQLGSIIRIRKKVKVGIVKIRSWANSFRLLDAVDGIDRRRQRRVLRWYADHIGEEYVPVIESGHSFRTKFLRLEAAMERENGGGNGGDGPRTRPTRDVRNKPLVLALEKRFEILEQHRASVGDQLDALKSALKQIGYSTSQQGMVEYLDDWFSESGNRGGAWLLEQGILYPSHLDPTRATMKKFLAYVRWTNGEEIHT